MLFMAINHATIMLLLGANPGVCGVGLSSLFFESTF